MKDADKSSKVVEKSDDEPAKKSVTNKTSELPVSKQPTVVINTEFTPWALDVRHDWVADEEGELQKSDLDSLVDHLQSQGRFPKEVFCTKVQADKIRKYDDYANVTLVVD